MVPDFVENHQSCNDAEANLDFNSCEILGSHCVAKLLENVIHEAVADISIGHEAEVTKNEEDNSRCESADELFSLQPVHRLSLGSILHVLLGRRGNVVEHREGD